MSQAILTIASIKKEFHTGQEKVEVLKDINLVVTEGTTVIISGESGSGKSTLLNLIAGMDFPTSGKIYIRNTDVTVLSEEEITQFRRNTIGFIFQFHFLLKGFNALENVMMPAFIAGVPGKKAKKRAEQLLMDVNLWHRRNHYLVQLSGGERQRIAVARSLMNNPDMIIADEPTGNLDEKNSKNVEDILFSLVERYKKTMILVTHDRGLAIRGNRHLSIEHGVLVGS
ncbi:MAG: ABC transporter ATP-binding protein [Spirochaetales bacterium]|nr:ABC transporter ATP-binding protein [Spirochaetales bacterium]